MRYLSILAFICTTHVHAFTLPMEEVDIVDERLQNADMLFEAGFYERSIDAYLTLLESTSQAELLMQVRLHLALAYAAKHDDEQAINTLLANIDRNPSMLNEKEEGIRRTSLFLAAMGYKELKKLDLANEALKTYLHLPTPPTLPLYEDARFEMALIAYHQANYDEATEIFRSLIPSKPLASLYLARINLKQNRPDIAAKSLATLSITIPQNDPLSYEIAYLQGEAACIAGNRRQAMNFFLTSLPKNHPEKSQWYPEAMYHLGQCYLKEADEDKGNVAEQAHHLEHAEEAFNKMITAAPQEKGYLALAQCHLARVKLLKDKDSYAKAEAILSQPNHFNTIEAKTHALLLRAEAAPTYGKRDALYRQLTQEENHGNAFYAKGWYLRGLNDFEEGQNFLEIGDMKGSRDLLKQASASFSRAFTLLKKHDNALAAEAIKYQALAISSLGDAQSDRMAYELIESLHHDAPQVWDAARHKDELLYLQGFLAGRLSRSEESYLPRAVKALEACAGIQDSKFGDLSLNYLGALYFQLGSHQKAEETYLKLINIFPNSPLAGEAWFWAASCADTLGKERTVGNQRRQTVFEKHPTSQYAAEAYFTYYTYQEYLQGDRNAIKHLQTFEEKYRTSPFLIEGYYLIGLDYLRDRKSVEGKWIRKRSLTDAIDAFQNVETLYETLKDEGLLPESKQAYYEALRTRATLQRAVANLSIAEESHAAKQKIYLEYAEEVFKTLMDSKIPPAIREEASFGLAKTYIKAGDDKKADVILSELLEKYKTANVTRGYYPARSWEEKGKIAMRQKDYMTAIRHFTNAEEAAKGGGLSTDQKLDLWIDHSLCCRGLEQYDEAILILSKVVNDDAVSSLRLKAMFLRAETYEEQGRPELARKQLESMVKKGGVWARKAKEKLEKDYGY